VKPAGGRRRRIAAGLLLVSTASLLTSAAARPATGGAQPVPPLIVLFASPTSEPLAGRIEAELLAAGMTPHRVTLPPTTAFEELAAIVSAAHAQGAIRVDAGATGAEVWLAEPITGRALLRQSLSSEPSPAMTSVIALRTVKFLRASFLPAEASPAPPPPAVVVSPPPAPATEPASRFRLAIAPALLFSAGGLGATVAAAATASIRLRRHLGIEVLGLVPVTTAQLDTVEGSSRVSVYLVGAGANLRWSPWQMWSTDVSAGVLAAIVRATGTAHAPLMGVTEGMTGAAPYARAGAAFGVSSWLALRADILVGDMVPRAVIQNAATWGRPMGAVMLGLQGGGS
jgi:hypothetical protein